MTFAEADRRYAELKQQFAAGTLTVDQFDDQLHELMVQDSMGRWWAKSRESGDWHYYDSVTDAWVQALPPAEKPAPPLPPEPQPKQQKPAKQDKHAAKAQPAEPVRPQPAAPQSPTAKAPAASTSAQPAGQEALPKWAAVAPGSDPATNPNPARLEPLSAAPATADTPAAPLAEVPDTPIPAPGSSSRLRDFGPVPELSGGLKLVLYFVSLLVPIAGILLFFVYRNKPAQADRAAARAFLILGVLSFVFICLCSGTFWLFEGMMFGTKPV